MSDDMPARPKTGRQLLDMDLTTLTEGELIVHLYVYDLVCRSFLTSDCLALVIRFLLKQWSPSTRALVHD